MKLIATALALAVASCSPAMAQDVKCAPIIMHDALIDRMEGKRVFMGTIDGSTSFLVGYTFPSGEYVMFVENDIDGVACILFDGVAKLAMGLGEPA